MPDLTTAPNTLPKTLSEGRTARLLRDRIYQEAVVLVNTMHRLAIECLPCLAMCQGNKVFAVRPLPKLISLKLHNSPDMSAIIGLCKHSH